MFNKENSTGTDAKTQPAGTKDKLLDELKSIKDLLDEEQAVPILNHEVLNSDKEIPTLENDNIPVLDSDNAIPTLNEDDDIPMLTADEPSSTAVDAPQPNETGFSDADIPMLGEGSLHSATDDNDSMQTALKQLQSLELSPADASTQPESTKPDSSTETAKGNVPAPSSASTTSASTTSASTTSAAPTSIAQSSSAALKKIAGRLSPTRKKPATEEPLLEEHQSELDLDNPAPGDNVMAAIKANAADPLVPDAEPGFQENPFLSNQTKTKLEKSKLLQAEALQKDRELHHIDAVTPQLTEDSANTHESDQPPSQPLNQEPSMDEAFDTTLAEADDLLDDILGDLANESLEQLPNHDSGTNFDTLHPETPDSETLNLEAEEHAAEDILSLLDDTPLLNEAALEQDQETSSAITPEPPAATDTSTEINKPTQPQPLTQAIQAEVSGKQTPPAPSSTISLELSEAVLDEIIDEIVEEHIETMTLKLRRRLETTLKQHLKNQLRSK